MVRLSVEIHEDCINKQDPMVLFTKEFVKKLECYPEFQALCSPTGNVIDSPDATATVLLCNEASFMQWECRRPLLGLHPVTEGPFTSDKDTVEYIDRHLAVINIDTSLAECHRLMIDCGETPEGAVRDFADTITHECIHLAYLMKYGNGKTPREIYLSEGEEGVRKSASLEGNVWDPIPVTDYEDSCVDDFERMAYVESHIEHLSGGWTQELVVGIIAASAFSDKLLILSRTDTHTQGPTSHDP